jgi:hypothetical protein
MPEVDTRSPSLAARRLRLRRQQAGRAAPGAGRRRPAAAGGRCRRVQLGAARRCLCQLNARSEGHRTLSAARAPAAPIERQGVSLVGVAGTAPVAPVTVLAPAPEAPAPEAEEDFLEVLPTTGEFTLEVGRRLRLAPAPAPAPARRHHQLLGGSCPLAPPGPYYAARLIRRAQTGWRLAAPHTGGRAAGSGGAGPRG